jgi:hypothetical protein
MSGIAVREIVFGSECIELLPVVSLVVLNLCFMLAEIHFLSSEMVRVLVTVCIKHNMEDDQNNNCHKMHIISPPSHI